MLNNRELLSKRKIQKMVSLPTISLAAAEADRFIDYIVDESVLKGNARIVRMEKETKNIRALGLGTAAFLHPAATFSSSDYKKTLTTQLIALTSKKARGCIVIYDDDLEDNVEGPAFADHLMRMVAKQIANELEEAFWIGDTASMSGFASTDVRCLWDGWRYRLDQSQSGDTYYNAVSGGSVILDASNTVTARAGSFSIVTGQYICETDASAPYSQEYKFDLMLKKLDSKYKTGGLANLRFWCNDQIAQDYIKSLSERATVLGDQAILGTAKLTYGTVPIVSVPMISTTMKIKSGDVQHEYHYPTDGNLTDCVLTHKDNFVVGIQRDIKLEAQREAADEATYWFYNIRGDVALENVNAAVLLKRLKVR